jgi:hypothetical protein
MHPANEQCPACGDVANRIDQHGRRSTWICPGCSLRFDTTELLPNPDAIGSHIEIPTKNVRLFGAEKAKATRCKRMA